MQNETREFVEALKLNRVSTDEKVNEIRRLAMRHILSGSDLPRGLLLAAERAADRE